ncbi:protein ANTI-SILENCING 1-like [Brassica napus]|uniref:protein ANTI-SILENCING 1-like n=1 Tax=Brassica napus TaxID=3708 RepID=UPI00207AE109|nr:protein ANTI-SILENCING 1-like [Brassica napus]
MVSMLGVRRINQELFVSVRKISPHLLEGVPDVLAKELFLASGEGPGLANVNPLIRSVQELRGTDMRNLQRRGRIDR